MSFGLVGKRARQEDERLFLVYIYMISIDYRIHVEVMPWSGDCAAPLPIKAFSDTFSDILMRSQSSRGSRCTYVRRLDIVEYPRLHYEDHDVLMSGVLIW